ncbi:hypothetical protein FACS1894102_6220 [Spirochaetia bacterium]|nr:hypothetical protein FACS1894102_6220 [Spirochaetia bacterium]
MAYSEADQERAAFLAEIKNIKERNKELRLQKEDKEIIKSTEKEIKGERKKEVKTQRSKELQKIISERSSKQSSKRKPESKPVKKDILNKIFEFKSDKENIDKIFRTPEIKIIHDDNISTDTGKKARGAFVLIDNNAEIYLSTKADAQTYIQEKIHALARTLTDEQLKEWDSLETGVDLRTAEGQEVFVDLMLHHLKNKKETGILYVDQIIEMIQNFIKELRRKLKDANVLTPEVKEYLDSLLSDPDSEATPEWNNYFKGEGGLFADNESGGGKQLSKLEDNIHTILHGTPEEKKALSQKFFHVADTPQFMKDLGLTGDYFSVKYGAITRHAGKDSEHNLTEKNWNELSEKITKPFAITKHGEGYRLFTTAKIDGKNIVVGVDVKKLGKDMEVNAIKTAFGKNNTTIYDEVVYIDKKIAPKQASLPGNHNYSPYTHGQELSSLSTGSAEKSSGDNSDSGDFDNTLYELEQDELETEARQAIDQGMSKEDFIQKMLTQDAVEYGLEDGTFDTSLKIAGITEAEKIAELEKAWQTANETAAKVDKELLPAENEEENADFIPDEYEGNTDFNPDEYEAQLASAYDKAAAPPPADGAITTTQADERFIDLMENEGERDKFITLMQFTQQEEEYADFEKQMKNRELADKVKRTYGALHIGAEHGVTNLTKSQKKGIHTFIKNHPTQMRLLYTELANNAEFSGYAENEIHDKPFIIDVIRTCTTTPGTMLKSQIPIRVYFDWDERLPGFFEIDTVAHVWILHQGNIDSLMPLLTYFQGGLRFAPC